MLDVGKPSFADRNISVRQKAMAYLLCSLLLGLIISAPIESAGQSKVKRYEPSKPAEPVPGQPYEKFFTRDRFGREIIFYISKTTGGQNPLPLVVYIEGSGCGSRFEERNGKIGPAGGHIVVADVFKDKARVLIKVNYSMKFHPIRKFASAML